MGGKWSPECGVKLGRGQTPDGSALFTYACCPDRHVHTSISHANQDGQLISCYIGEEPFMIILMPSNTSQFSLLAYSGEWYFYLISLRF